LKHISDSIWPNGKVFLAPFGRYNMPFDLLCIYMIFVHMYQSNVFSPDKAQALSMPVMYQGVIWHKIWVKSDFQQELLLKRACENMYKACRLPFGIPCFVKGDIKNVHYIVLPCIDKFS
jgi:hypothetical protein